MNEKPLVWLKGEVKTPPFSVEARREAGYHLGEIQRGASLSMPQSRPMPAIGAGCHELRIKDDRHEWRIVYRPDERCVLIVDVFPKTTQRTPKHVIDTCKARIALYDKAIEEAKKRGTR